MPTEVPAPDVTDPADLYSLPLDRFTASRDLLARWLRSQARDDEAKTVATLRKPSLAAWGLNRAKMLRIGSESPPAVTCVHSCTSTVSARACICCTIQSPA